MEYDSATFLHGSDFYQPTDVRGFLAEIINEGKSGDLFGEGFWREKRPFWDKSLQELLDNGQIDRWMRESMKKHGLQ
jgi:hypothetical protein